MSAIVRDDRGARPAELLVVAGVIEMVMGVEKRVDSRIRPDAVQRGDK
jgi:hypothetical protein